MEAMLPAHTGGIIMIEDVFAVLPANFLYFSCGHTLRYMYYTNPSAPGVPEVLKYQRFWETQKRNNRIKMNVVACLRIKPRYERLV